ncbi:MAG: hypothetical protein WCA10_19280 [Terracidiphilus sp.]
MPSRFEVLRRTLLHLVICSFAFQLQMAHAATCSTQSQMPLQQRDLLANQARAMIALVQQDNIAGLRARTLPAIAADFDAIAASVTSLSPLMQNSTITVEDLYLLDASMVQPGAERTQFFCGSPTVVLTFNGIPAGKYALAILHATGVPHPQQISIILASTPGDQWQLAGFYAKPMLVADHDGVWYWASARKFAQTKSDWPAMLYFRVAQNLLSPVDFLSSPNLEKLQQETDQARPGDLPGKSPLMLNARGSTFEVTTVDTTTQFGALDIDLHYTPNPEQVAQLRVPVSARQQVTDVMSALLLQHPDLKQAFHGIWIHADQGNGSLFALELPMDQIPSGPQPQAANTPTAMH